VTATGSVSTAQMKQLSLFFAVSGTGSATTAQLRTAFRSFSASATGTAALARALRLNRTVAVTAVGSTSLGPTKLSLHFAVEGVGEVVVSSDTIINNFVVGRDHAIEFFEDMRDMVAIQNSGMVEASVEEARELYPAASTETR
jgi:hypothetical protein